jgi:hypothetical protein
MDQEFTTEADCPVCSAWPDNAKDKRRSELERVPLRDPICIACFVAFWSDTNGPQFTEENFRRRSYGPICV